MFHFQTALKYAGNDPMQKELIEKEIKTLEPGKTKEKKPDHPEPERLIFSPRIGSVALYSFQIVFQGLERG